MSEKKITEDYLSLLIHNNGIIDSTTIDIDRYFETETNILEQLCEGGDDNINEIIKFINSSLKPKLPNTKKVYNYCKDFDEAFQSVYVNIEFEIQDILRKRDLIFTKQKNALEEKKEFNLEEDFRKLKDEIREKIKLWFKAFDIEFAYDKAKKTPNMLVYSHRISGWSNPEYKITDNLHQEVKTNFGYGSVSYFFSLLTYKNIQIIPLSEWIDYQYSKFSEVKRYTRSFRRRIPVVSNGWVYFKVKIENEDWIDALDFTKNAANLSLTNEKEFVDKFIISECEAMVNGLENFYNNDGFELIDEKEKTKKYLSLEGYELIDFKTEKIIGALDFISKIIEYNQIVPTEVYTTRMITLAKKFIPSVHLALDNQHQELNNAKKDFEAFLNEHNKLIEKNEFYENERLNLKSEFNSKYLEEFYKFRVILNKSLKELEKHNHKIKLHTETIAKLTWFITKYNQFIDNNPG